MARIQAEQIRQMPLYSPAEAAQFLRLPASTVRAWSFGQAYKDAQNRPRRFKSLIDVADAKNRRLSFINLIELSVLSAVRRVHQVPLARVRDAMDYLRKHLPSPHPLADQRFQTDGVDLFVREVGRLVNISKDGQLEMSTLISRYLRGVERDATGVPIKLYLPRTEPGTNGLSGVVIDPARGFGRPIIDKAGIRTEIVLQRFRAGETIESLADDYAIKQGVIEELIRTELPRAA